MINIVVVGQTLTNLANCANTKVKREVLVVFINFSPLGVCHKEWNSREWKGFQTFLVNYEAQCKKQELFT